MDAQGDSVMRLFMNTSQPIKMRVCTIFRPKKKINKMIAKHKIIVRRVNSYWSKCSTISVEFNGFNKNWWLNYSSLAHFFWLIARFRCILLFSRHNFIPFMTCARRISLTIFIKLWVNCVPVMIMMTECVFYETICATIYLPIKYSVRKSERVFVRLTHNLVFLTP